MAIKESLRKKAERDMGALGTVVKMDDRVAKYLMDNGVSQEEAWKFVGDELIALQERKGGRAIFGVTNKRIEDAYENMGTLRGEHLAQSVRYGKPFFGKKHEQHYSGSSLERRMEILVGFGSLLMSLTFLSTNLTGFAVGNLNPTDANIAGAIFFAIGILMILINLRRR